MKLFLVILLLLAQAANAATFFVDFSAGSDAAAGTSAGTAWQHCPGDALATGTAAGTSLSPGDKVIFKGGVAYLSKVTVSQSGSVASPITFDGNTAGTFGTGMAVFSGSNVDSDARRYGFVLATSANTYTISNIVFTGIQFTRFGGRGTDDPANITWNCSTLPASVEGYGILLEQCDRITVASCLFTNIGDWTNAPNMGNLESGYGVKLDGRGSHITIVSNEFTRVGNRCVTIMPEATGDFTTNITIAYNNIHNFIKFGVALTPGVYATNCICNNIWITNNSFHDMWEYSANVWQGCAGDNPHMDGIIAFLGYSPTATTGATLGTVANPLVIAGNDFYNNVSYTNQGGTANIYLSGYGGRVLIYNNLFRNVLNLGEGAIYLGGFFDLAGNSCSAVDYEILNNSFFDQTFGVYLASNTQVNSLTNGTVKLQNNIFVHTVSTNTAVPVAFGADAWSKPTTCDYNSYLTIRSDGIINTSWGVGVTAYNDFAALQALGYEAHGLYGDPLFFNTTYGLGTQSSQNDLRIYSNSPCAGTATNLASIFTKDYSGATRSVWDMGAYAASGTPAPIALVTIGGSATISGVGRIGQ